MEKKYVIGVDVGGTTVKIGLFTVEGERLKQWEIKTRTENGGEAILPDTAASIRETLQTEGIDLQELAGVGLGVPGPADDKGYVNVCVNLGWKGSYPAEILSNLLDRVPAKVGNDANVAALGEQWLGSGRGTKDMIMITLGTGVGGGVILDGRIVAGPRGIGGEIGHMLVNPAETAVCNCGGRGCLEQYASATGIRRTAMKILEESNTESVLRQMEDFTAKDVFDAAKEGDEAGVQAVEVLGHYLGMVLANLSMTVDPEAFVIGGGVSRAGQFLLDVVDRYYDQYLNITDQRAKVILAELGNDAGICGAAKMVL